MIKDYETYNERMSKTLFDKAFFIDKIYGVEVVVDFGCADGSLIRYLNKINPNLFYVGYDNDPVMIEAASHKTQNENTCFTSSLEEVENFVRGKKWAINFSSVLHEVSWDSLGSLETFLKKTKPNYVCVRDMNCSIKSFSPQAKEKIENDKMWEKYYDRNSYQYLYTEDYIEYLLKRTYIQNWEKEKKERYFSGFPKFEFGLRLKDYTTIWDVKYCLPYQKLQWLHDFGFDYSKERFTTHRQLIVSNMFNLPS